MIAVARTERQADALAAILTFALVLLGGNFVYVWAAPAMLQLLALATPNGWVLRAFTDLATGAVGASVVVVPVLVCLGCAAVAGALAVLLSRRAVSR